MLHSLYAVQEVLFHRHSVSRIVVIVQLARRVDVEEIGIDTAIQARADAPFDKSLRRRLERLGTQVMASLMKALRDLSRSCHDTAGLEQFLVEDRFKTIRRRGILDIVERVVRSNEIPVRGSALKRRGIDGRAGLTVIFLIGDRGPPQA